MKCKSTSPAIKIIDDEPELIYDYYVKKGIIPPLTEIEPEVR
ncbi:hypothetical protein HZS_7044, partial [Henneguya salminicola]